MKVLSKLLNKDTDQNTCLTLLVSSCTVPSFGIYDCLSGSFYKKNPQFYSNYMYIPTSKSINSYYHLTTTIDVASGWPASLGSTLISLWKPSSQRDSDFLHNN